MIARVADLHLHTFYSDGTHSPRQLLELAKQSHLTAVAITDHDIVEGYDEGLEAASELGLELIPGIEMSAASGEKEVHVLGLFIDPKNAPLLEHLAKQKTRRVARIHDTVKRLQGLGLSITAEDVFAVVGKGTAGRLHVAQALVRKGHVASPEEAFTKYIGNSGPAFIQGASTAPKTVIQLIRQAGGIPVLAHPIYLKDDALIEQFVRDGLVGIEVYHSGHQPDAVRRYEQLADRLGLLRTGGTDYHGAAKEGAPIGSIVIPYALVEALKEWKQTHTSA